MSSDYLLGIDAGQTATKALLVARDGTVLGHGRGGPADHFHGPSGVERNRAAIHGAIRSAFATAGLPVAALAAVALGSTGVHDAAAEGPQAEALIREIVDPAAVIVRPDFVTNLLGASGGGPGIVVIAGGGAIAYGLAEDGREALAGGFGYLIGDEGSAYDIGRRAIIAAARAGDGRDRPTVLEQLVCDVLQIARSRDLPRIVYRADFGRERISALAPSVAAAAQSGDAVAGAIMTSAGEELAGMALACARQLYPAHAAVSIYLTGGVFNAGEIVLVPVRRVLAERWPEAALPHPRYAPVVGALALARQATGAPADRHWLERVAHTAQG